MLTLSRRQYAHIIAHARAGAPEEVCGLIAGAEGRTRAVYRAPNVAKRPCIEYEMDPEVQLCIFEHLDRRGWDVLGIYHSHPEGPDVPSASDVAQSHYPDAVYVIVSLKNGVRMRGFSIRDGAYTEAALRGGR